MVISKTVRTFINVHLLICNSIVIKIEHGVFEVKLFTNINWNRVSLGITIMEITTKSNHWIFLRFEYVLEKLIMPNLLGAIKKFWFHSKRRSILRQQVLRRHGGQDSKRKHTCTSPHGYGIQSWSVGKVRGGKWWVVIQKDSMRSNLELSL